MTVIRLVLVINTTCCYQHTRSTSVCQHVPRRYHDISKLLTCCDEATSRSRAYAIICHLQPSIGGAHTCLRDVGPHALPHHPSNSLSRLLRSVHRVHVPRLLTSSKIKENHQQLYKLQSVFLQAPTRSETLSHQLCCNTNTNITPSPTIPQHRPHNVNNISIRSRICNSRIPRQRLQIFWQIAASKHSSRRRKKSPFPLIRAQSCNTINILTPLPQTRYETAITSVDTSKAQPGSPRRNSTTKPPSSSARYKTRRWSSSTARYRNNGDLVPH
jgi:hypothetical protein